MDARYDGDRFRELQARLGPMWPSMTLRRREEHRTLILVSSISVDVPPAMHPLLPVFEERYLIYVLALVRQPHTRVIYVTSQPILPQLLDYYLGLVPGLADADVRDRLRVVSVGDTSARPLTEKILERPRLLRRLRSLVDDPDLALILPFVTTSLEARLAIELGVPLYGPDPRLSRLGSKTGSRELFAAAGVPHPRGSSGVRSIPDLVAALSELRAGERPPRQAVVKLDDAVSGWGNATVDLAGADTDDKIEECVRRCVPEDSALDADRFLATLAGVGGVVEERIEGPAFCSPSVQLRTSPYAEVEVLSTHDQMLGGITGQTYEGCRFPAAAEYAAQISDQAAAVGSALAERGVIGRFGIDFVAVRGVDGWDTFAVEINLRNGGTTHPMLTMLTLTEGDYDVASAQFVVDGRPKHYVATDHLHVPRLELLTPDDVLELIRDEHIGWDTGSHTGVVFHLISGVPIAGRIGFTAIGDSADEAAALYDRVEQTLSRAAAE